MVTLLLILVFMQVNLFFIKSLINTENLYNTMEQLTKFVCTANLVCHLWSLIN